MHITAPPFQFYSRKFLDLLVRLLGLAAHKKNITVVKLTSKIILKEKPSAALKEDSQVIPNSGLVSGL